MSRTETPAITTRLSVSEKSFLPRICKSICPAFVDGNLQGSSDPCGKDTPNLCGVTYDPGKMYEFVDIIV